MKWSILVAIIAGIPGAILTFVDPRTLVSWGLGIGRHNDRVLVGMLLLTIAIVSLYRFFTPMHQPKKSKKRK